MLQHKTNQSIPSDAEISQDSLVLFMTKLKTQIAFLEDSQTESITELKDSSLHLRESFADIRDSHRRIEGSQRRLTDGDEFIKSQITSLNSRVGKVQSSPYNMLAGIDNSVTFGV